jgi:hypothetical protein
MTLSIFFFFNDDQDFQAFFVAFGSINKGVMSLNKIPSFGNP